MTTTAAGVPRTLAAVVVLATTLAGLGGRALLPGAVAGPLGDALYATLLVWVVVLVAPRTRPAVAAAVSLVASTAIEASHLTPWPAELLERFPLARFVLGTTFGVPDLVWYAAGAALGGALVAVLRSRPATVDEALRHVRERPGGGARGLPRLLVPVAVVGLVATVGLGVGRTLSTEADELSARVADARAELTASEGRVSDEAVRASLDDLIGEAVAVGAGTPLLDRRPGDAPAAVDRLDAAIAEVHASRRSFATATATAVRETFGGPQRRAERVLSAVDELVDEGREAGEAARSGLRDALASAQDALAATGPDHLSRMPLDELEDAADALTERRDAVKASTTELLVAQDAVACPEVDQRWDPVGGRLAEADLAPIPWAPRYRVRADLLDGLVALDDAYRAEFGTHLVVNSAYRSYDDQMAVFNPANPNPLAAPPGCSNHGLGTAVDLSMGPEGFDGARFAWMTEHAAEHGWVHPDWAGPDGRLPEPWHWESVETPRSS